VTALYEMALESRDGSQLVSDSDAAIATVFVRYQDAESREIKEVSRSIRVSDLLPSIEDAPASFQVQAAAAEFAELLRGSFWAQEGSYGDVLRLLQMAEPRLEDNAQLAELVDMVRAAIRHNDR
jgi:Ca-activated chloride channel homolog